MVETATTKSKWYDNLRNVVLTFMYGAIFREAQRYHRRHNGRSDTICSFSNKRFDFSHSQTDINVSQMTENCTVIESRPWFYHIIVLGAL